MKTLGVIGGVGPMATAYFLRRVIEMTDAKTDQEHIEVLLHSKPSIPDRTRFILGQSDESPLPDFVRIAKSLAEQGAQVIAIPCVTAHFFQHQIEDAVGVPVLNAVEETALCLQAAGIERAGLMATDGTVSAGLFRSVFAQCGIELLIPGTEGQRRIMHLIYDNIKAGLSPELDCLEQADRELKDRGAQAIILGCTELSVVKRDFPLGPEYLDALDALARRSVLDCGKLREEYRSLI